MPDKSTQTFQEETTTTTTTNPTPNLQHVPNLLIERHSKTWYEARRKVRLGILTLHSSSLCTQAKDLGHSQRATKMQKPSSNHLVWTKMGWHKQQGPYKAIPLPSTATFDITFEVITNIPDHVILAPTKLENTQRFSFCPLEYNPKPESLQDMLKRIRNN